MVDLSDPKETAELLKHLENETDDLRINLARNMVWMLHNFCKAEGVELPELTEDEAQDVLAEYPVGGW